MEYPNPQAAYKAGFALRDFSLDDSTHIYFRHVTEQGHGTVYLVPRSQVIDAEMIVQSAGHGGLYGAPLVDVEAVASDRRSIQ